MFIKISLTFKKNLFQLLDEIVVQIAADREKPLDARGDLFPGLGQALEYLFKNHLFSAVPVFVL